MYRLFQRIPKGLDPVADIFKEHVDSEGMKLVKEVICGEGGGSEIFSVEGGRTPATAQPHSPAQLLLSSCIRPYPRPRIPLL